MFDQLSERLQGVFNNVRGDRVLTEENMEEAIREVRRALLEADVSLRVIKAFVSRLKDRAVGEEVLKNVNPGQQLIKIVHDELVALLGGESVGLNLPDNGEGDPNVLVLFGLQGSGKTTSAAKLALHLRKKEGKNPLLVAADVYRPAAIDQLITLGKQIDIPVHTIEGGTDVQEIARTGVAKAKAEGYNPVIIDTAGRLQVDTDMMAELLLLERSLKPQEKLLVIDAMTGQEAVTVAETFNTQLDVTGIVVTKLDGDARGGAALSVVEITEKPIKFIGTSEKLTGLEPFHPDRMADRILGMGDVISLVEKAQEAIDIEEAKKMEEKMRKQSFSIEDFLKVQKQLKMLGSLDQILGMLPIPGITKEMREMLAHGGEKQLKRIEAMASSMTPEERQQPDIIRDSRIRRIAKGCGMPEAEVKQFLAQFDMMKQMMKGMMKMQDKAAGSGPGGGPPARAPGGLHMPRSSRKKKKKNKLPGGFPGMPTGGFPNMPGGMPGEMPSEEELKKLAKKFPGGLGGGKFPF